MGRVEPAERASPPHTESLSEPYTPPPGLSVWRRMRKYWADYLYILPALLVMVIVIGYPLVYTIYLGFFKDDPFTGTRTFNGLGNYTTLLRSERFWDITWNTFYWTIFSTFFAFVIGFAAAIVIHRDFIGRGVVRGHPVDSMGDFVRGSRICLALDPAQRLWTGQRDAEEMGLDRFQHHLPRLYDLGNAQPDHGQRLERVSLRHDHDAGRIANGTPAASAGGAS